MRPVFADAIDIPIVLLGGMIVLIPLLTFEVFVEALILKKVWKLPYRNLCTLTFFANCWSLLAGIPTKILNTFVAVSFVPEEIPGFIARYPTAIAVGSLIYFAVTVLVEAAYAFRWRRKKQLTLSRRQIWRGMLLANLATYAVLAPLSYYGMKPYTAIREFRHDTRWTAHPNATVLFVSQPHGFLNSIHADGSAQAILVPVPMTDYLISSNLDMCLFCGTNGSLYFYQKGFDDAQLIRNTAERFNFRHAAFSPSGQHVAFVSENEESIELVDTQSRIQTTIPMPNFKLYESSLAWSPKEDEFFIAGFQNKSRLKITIQPDGKTVTDSLPGTNAPETLSCYGAVDGTSDICGDLKAYTWLGLDSGLVIRREGQQTNSIVLDVAVRPGWLHLSGFFFDGAEFLDGCNECLCEANGYIYVLDIPEKRLGTLVRGTRFQQLTPSHEKSL